MQLLEPVILFLFLLTGFVLMWRIPLLKPNLKTQRKKSSISYRLSIIIPARNEAHRINPLLESLYRTASDNIEIIVINDNSTDQTVRIAGSKGATVVAGETLPAGWQGKNWACWQGANKSKGDVLLFLDADTWFEENGLEALLAAWQCEGGLLTVQPFHITKRVYEQCSAIFNIVLMASLNAFTLFGTQLKLTGGFGPCMICSREDYYKTGGHAAIKSQVLEDVALVKLFSKSGIKVRCYGGKGVIHFRMYPAGIAELFEGWSKNFVLGASSVSLLSLILVVAWICGSWGAFVYALRGVSIVGGPQAMVSCLLYVLYAWQIHFLLQKIGRFAWLTSVLYPLPLGFFTCVMFYSLFITRIVKKVKWKGRVIDL